MDHNKLDKIRERNDMEQMDPKNRKDLLSKFQKAGGEVIELNTPVGKKPLKHINRPSMSGRQHSNKKNMSDTCKSDVRSGMSANKKSSTVANTAKKGSRLTLFFIKLSCFFANIFNFGATQFSQKFLDLTLNKVYTEFNAIKILLDPVFKNTTESLNFREFIIEQHAIEDYELAYHVYNLFQDTWFVDLQKTMPLSVDATEESFKKIFRQLYVFQSYHKKMIAALYHIVQKYDEFSSKNLNNNVTRQKFSSFFTIIWAEWLVWVEELENYFWYKYTVEKEKKEFVQYLGVTSEMFTTVGKLSKEWLMLYEQKKEKGEESSLEAVSLYPSDEVAKGMEFINQYIDFIAYKQSFDVAKDLRSLFTNQDKIFYTYVLLDFLDKEYTCVWNNIVFYVIPEIKTGRFDAKKEIKATINRLHHFYEMMNEYLRFIRAHTVRENMEMTEKQEAGMSKHSFDIRKNLIAVLNEYKNLLTKVVSSKSAGHEIIGNWDEKISIKHNADSYTNEKTIMEIMTSALNYLNAFEWLLKHSDLSGLSYAVNQEGVLVNKVVNMNK